MPRLACLALVLLVTGLAYASSLSGGLVYDDLLLVHDNPTIRSFANAGDWLTRSFWAGAESSADAAKIPFYRPGMTAFFALGYRLSGESPLGYHLLAVAAHLAATAMVFAVGRRFLSPFGATAAALLFGLIPIHTENVAWVSGAADAVAATAGLGAVACLSRRSLLVPAFLLALLSFLTKESALAIPAAAFVLDALLGRGRLARYGVFLAAFVVYAALRTRVYGSDAGLSLTQTWWNLPAWRTSALPFELFGRSISKLVEPLELNAFRVLRVDISASSESFLFPLAVSAVTALAAVTLGLRSRTRPSLRAPLAFLLFTSIALVPMVARPRSLGHFPFCDRFLYVPSIGFCWLLGWSAERLGERSRFVAVSVVALLAAIYGIRTVERIPVWRDEPSLYRQSLLDSPDSATVKRSLGRLALERYERSGKLEDLDEAFDYFRAAVDKGLRDRVFVSSDDVIQSQIGLGYVQLARGQAEIALALAEAVIADYPDHEEAHALAGVSAALLGNTEKAEASLKRAIEIRPNFAKAHANLGRLYFLRREFGQALLALGEALRIDPDNVEARLDRASSLLALNRTEEAVAEMKACLARAPDHPSAPRLRELLRDLDRPK